MELNIINMYPDVLNLYGDSGNITCIKQRAKWRGITLNIQDLTVSSDVQVNEDTDMILIGGGSDSGQSTVATNLLKQASALENYIENDGVILAISGSYQMFGQTYIDPNNNKLPCLELLDINSISQGEKLMGNIVTKANIDLSNVNQNLDTFVGFESHTARTKHNYEPLGFVQAGFGNNDEDKKEGAVYKNFIGSYLHGPLLPKNPHLADYMILKALENKYDIDKLEVLDDEIEINAHNSMVNKILTK